MISLLGRKREDILVKRESNGSHPSAWQGRQCSCCTLDCSLFLPESRWSSLSSGFCQCVWLGAALFNSLDVLPQLVNLP